MSTIPSTTSSLSAASASASSTLVPPTGNVEIDIQTLLTQLKNTEGDREKLLQQIQAMQEKINKLTEGKKAEMQKALDTVINDWLQQSVQDEAVREEFKKGMSRLVEQTAEDSGVWRVVVCASNLHRKNLEELESLRTEIGSVRQGLGNFREEERRKRPLEEVNNTYEGRGGGGGGEVNIWEQFAESMKGRTWEPAL